ncbi:MAG TPA: hypothetical protein DCP62_02310 [Erysipelotrichaceae bacterium]|nr:MAG: hypothetical protein A2Y19_10000 [Firmicutes bacterium GWE2_51_13]HAM62521.1 hypothetical protein [Erysipelotrichaceae bacterium]HAO61773.1 hypothetical protein [Erysipelotrichaceae bacterium]
MRMTTKQTRLGLSILSGLVIMIAMPLTVCAQMTNTAEDSSRALFDQAFRITKVQPGWIPNFASILYLVLLAGLFLVLLAVIVMSIKFRQEEKRDIL